MGSGLRTRKAGDSRIVVFYPHNPFAPQHGSHLRCLQQLEDLCSNYSVILASSTTISDTPWPFRNDDLRELARQNHISKIELYEQSIAWRAERFSGYILRGLRRLIPQLSINWITTWLHQALLVAWFNSLILRHKCRSIVIHYTYWTYLSRVMTSGLKVMELHDIIPINEYLTKSVGEWIQAGSSLSSSDQGSKLKYIDSIVELPAHVNIQNIQIVKQLNRYDLVWMISHREERLLKELGLEVESDIIYPLMSSEDHVQVKTLPPILPIGPNAFNTYSLAKFIEDVIPLLDEHTRISGEIQVTGRFWEDRTIPMPSPLRYYGVISDYSERLNRSAFMIAPTCVGTGQQMKVFEALASGIPVIAYRCAVPEDVLAENPCIIGVNSPEDFAAAISQLLNDKSFLQRHWKMALEAKNREAKRRAAFPYSSSLKRALSAHNVHQAGLRKWKGK